MTGTRTLHQERLGVPLRWWVQATMLVASFWLAMVVALPGPVAWLVTAVAAVATAALLLGYGWARLLVTDEAFHAGRARIEVRHLGEARALDAAQTRRAAGVDADARAWLVLRPYLKRSVRVEVADPRDPTPYWLVSTRRPDELVRALREVAGPGGGAARVEAPHVQED